MNHVLLLRQLNRVGWRYRQLRLWQLLALVWLTAAGLGLAFWALQPATGKPLPWLMLIACMGAVSAAILSWRSARDPRWIARRVEATFPELRTCLLAAIEQEPQLPSGRFGYLQQRVIDQAFNHSRSHRWPNIVSPGKMKLAAGANVLCFASFLAIAGLLTFHAPQQPTANAATKPPTTTPVVESVITVEPGNAEVERGTSLLILARVQGPMPGEAELVIKNDGGEEITLPMSPSLNDPVFGGRIPVVDQPLTYHVSTFGQATESYRVTVFEYPRLERADAVLVYPEYTGLEKRVVQDIRTVSVVEGTQLTLQCFLNKQVDTARLIDTRDANAVPVVLNSSQDDPLRYEAHWTCTESRRFKLELVDDAGREMQKLVQFSVNVLPNQPPDLKVVFPAKDLEVSPLEELDLAANVWDDFGVHKLGLTFSLAGAGPVDIILLENAAAKERHAAAHVLLLEDHAAEPDQLLTYYWWAEDIGPDGKLRRVFGDMYFAEVRPFEEIFRQGEQLTAEQQRQQQQNQQQGQGQNAQDAQQLAQLQKDIINAIWKLVRRETTGDPTPALSADAEQVQLSQESALEQATSLAERVTDEQSAEHVQDVLKYMQTAAEELKLAAVTPDSDTLRPALTAAQQAYQSLLKLPAREHEVVRQQQQQQGQSSSQQQSSARSQQQRQQMQQLDLQNEENRYETERTAQEQQQESAEEREDRQVQNRLRELARRQSDVNDRLKELQTALEEAQTEEEQEEIRRQLKRLQDEQQQILQDTDELQSRLDQPENAERMAEQQRQLDETRDQVRRASEALEQQRVTQAAAAGTRAEQQFEELREEFRRRSANRFNEEMQEMRQEARQLQEQEEKLAEQLQDPQPEADGPPKLEEEVPQVDKIADAVRQQRQRLDDLQERMRNTIGEAEESEPLLSQRLYDAIRNVQDNRVEQALQQTENAVRRGLSQQAQELENVAGEGVRELRQAVDRAAEAVLGDETEALRRARQALQDLSRELNEEVRRNNSDAQPGENTNQQPGQQSSQQNSDQQGSGQRSEQPGNQQGQPQQPGSGQQPQEGQQQGNTPGNQAGEQSGQPGERQPGERGQPGEQPGNQPESQQGSQPGQSQSPGQPGEGQLSNQQGSGERQPGQQQPSQQQTGQQQSGQGQPQGQPGQGQPGEPQQRGPRQLTGGPTGGGNPEMDRTFAPLTGEDFREWSDRLRDVEEMVGDPELRAEAARIRERARAIRAELKRHSADPNWDLVQQQVAGPLVELEDRVAEELLRRTTKKALVPLDRDPVPPQYSEKTRKYYEQLGSGK